MKSLIPGLGLILLSFAANAQTTDLPEKLMTRRLPSCQDIQYNSATIIPELHAAGKKDTLAQLMRFWKAQCGYSSYYFAYLTLSAIHERRFSENLYGNAPLIDLLDAFRVESSPQPRYVCVDCSPLYPTPANESYVHFIRDIAKTALDIDGLSPLERLLALYYSSPDEAVLDELMKGQYGVRVGVGTRNGRTPGAVQRRLSDYSIGLGVWVPNGNLSVLGPHPFLGLYAGSLGKRWEHGIAMNVRFLRSANRILVREEDSLFNSNYYFGLQLGYEAAYALYAKPSHRLEILGGAGVDIQQLLNEERFGYRDNYTNTAYSLNVNGGLGYRYFYSKFGYVGVQARYHAINFCNPRGTDLTGNAITIGLVWGGVSR